MRRKSLLLILLFLPTLGKLQAQRSTDIVGKWQDVDHPEKRVMIYQKEERYFGKSLEEKSNPVFKNLIWEKVSNTYTGILINPANQEEYEVEIQWEGKDLFKFTVGPFIFKRTFRFKRL